VPTAQQVVGISAVDDPWRYLEDLPIAGISTRHCKGCPLYTEVSRLALPLGDHLTGPAAYRGTPGRQTLTWRTGGRSLRPEGEFPGAVLALGRIRRTLQTLGDNPRIDRFGERLELDDPDLFARKVCQSFAATGFLDAAPVH